MRILVTGGSGFIGRFLLRSAVERGHEATGTFLGPAELDAISERPRDVRWEPMDLTDRPSVDRVVDSVRPDAVFHLGAQAYAGRAWEAPVETFETNVLGTIYLYEALRRHPASNGVFLASSAAAYGVVPPERQPTNEESALHPINPYGVSKACQDMLSLQYFENFGLRILRGRLFITTGPGKVGDALNDFAHRVAAIERTGRAGKLRVGNLEVRRDISDVRDVVRAIWTVFERGDPRQPVNIGAGRSYRIRDVADTLTRLARVPVTVEPDPALFRPTDEAEIRSDISRLRGLGYAPTIPLETTIEDSLDHWRRFGSNAR